MPISKDDMYENSVMLYLRAHLAYLQPPYDYTRIKSAVLETTQDLFTSQNQVLPKSARVKLPDQLSNSQIARLIQYLEPVKRISCRKDPDGGTDFDLLGIYQTDGYNAGTYDTHDQLIEALIRNYKRTATRRDVEEIRAMLQCYLPRSTRCMDPDLIAVNNGIFNYRTKQLHPFDPDRIFLSKSHVDYVPNARNVTIHNPGDGTDWDVVSWVRSLSDDPEIVELIWQVLGAIIRPYIPWGKLVAFYSHGGCSGKGTLCALMRNLCGGNTCVSIPVANFGKDFMLEPLIHASAVIVDENDVGEYIDKAGELKAAVTGDALPINRKFKMPVTFQFLGLIIQCFNELPRVKDKTGSLYRRLLLIPFDKCFTGAERKYIKDDYLKRPEVLQYVLFKILNMDYYGFSEPAACKELLNEYREYNDPVREFATEMLPKCQWDLLPSSFLYSLYKAWFAQNSPSGRPQGRNTFLHDLMQVTAGNPVWEYHKGTVRPGNGMDRPEPLILDYALKDWMNPKYLGTDKNQICRPQVSQTYSSGLVRRTASAAASSQVGSVGLGSR